MKILLKIRQIINYLIESILDFLHHILEYIFGDWAEMKFLILLNVCLVFAGFYYSGKKDAKKELQKQYQTEKQMRTYWENDEMKSNQPLALIGTDGYVHVLHYNINSDKKSININISELERLLKEDDCKTISIEKLLEDINNEIK